MKVELWCVGKTKEKNVRSLIDFYRKRCDILWPIKICEWQEAKSKNARSVVERQSEILIKKVETRDYLILLDEKGKKFGSVDFADYLQKKIDLPNGRLIFLIGGAYGFGKLLYDRADDLLALSSMTFPHDLVRVIFLEQFYRALTINRNLPYHHS